MNDASKNAASSPNCAPRIVYMTGMIIMGSLVLRDPNAKRALEDEVPDNFLNQTAPPATGNPPLKCPPSGYSHKTAEAGWRFTRTAWEPLGNTMSRQ